MNVTEYIIPLSENARKRHYHVTDEGDFACFSVQLEVFVNNRWQVVIRYDSSHGFAHIDHMGNVRSCSIARGSYGNILETPLTEIWVERLAHFRSLKWLPKKCQECEDFCGGGCTASCYDGGMYCPDEFIQPKQRRM